MRGDGEEVVAGYSAAWRHTRVPGGEGPKYRYTWSRPRRNTYLPTYLMRALSISPTVSLSFFLPRARPLSPLLHPRAPSSPPRCADPRASYTAGSPRHDARHRATAGTNRPVVYLTSPTTRVATSPSSSPFLSFFFLSISLFLLYRSVASARNFAERVRSFCRCLTSIRWSSRRFQDSQGDLQNL